MPYSSGPASEQEHGRCRYPGDAVSVQGLLFRWLLFGKVLSYRNRPLRSTLLCRWAKIDPDLFSLPYLVLGVNCVCQIYLFPTIYLCTEDDIWYTHARTHVTHTHVTHPYLRRTRYACTLGPLFIKVTHITKSLP